MSELSNENTEYVSDIINFWKETGIENIHCRFGKGNSHGILDVQTGDVFQHKHKIDFGYLSFDPEAWLQIGIKSILTKKKIALEEDFNDVELDTNNTNTCTALVPYQPAVPLQQTLFLFYLRNMMSNIVVAPALIDDDEQKLSTKPVVKGKTKPKD